jgi:hypothetical protein
VPCSAHGRCGAEPCDTSEATHPGPSQQRHVGQAAVRAVVTCAMSTHGKHHLRPLIRRWLKPQLSSGGQSDEGGTYTGCEVEHRLAALRESSRGISLAAAGQRFPVVTHNFRWVWNGGKKTHFPIPLYKHGIQSILTLISLTQPLFPTSQMSPKC